MYVEAPSTAVFSFKLIAHIGCWSRSIPTILRHNVATAKLAKTFCITRRSDGHPPLFRPCLGRDECPKRSGYCCTSLHRVFIL